MRDRGIALFIFLLLASLIASWRFWWQSQQRQYALNRTLIAALAQDDNRQALKLVNTGADPNTRDKPQPMPSIKQLWDQLVHRDAGWIKDNPTALLIFCQAPLHPSNGRRDSQGNELDSRGTLQLLDAMLMHGADVNQVDENGWTPLMTVLLYDSHTSNQMVGLLLQHNPNINAQSKDGWTALHYAVWMREDKKVVRQLLAHGANPNLQSIEGDTPLTLALSSQHSDLVALLKQYGARDMRGIEASVRSSSRILRRRGL